MQVDLKKYDTIIFDFGGVIMDIDPELTINAFHELCSPQELESIMQTDLFWSFERGEISAIVFLEKINQSLEFPILEEDFLKAWCAILLDFYPERIHHIKQLAQKYKLILLSNTNEIHYASFSAKLMDQYSLSFEDLFEKVYLSFKMGMVKPTKAIYERVIEEQQLIPEKTLLIEDTKENAAAASELGINTLVIPRNDQFYNYLKYENIKE